MDIAIGIVLWLIVLGITVYLLHRNEEGSNIPKYKRCPSCFEEIKQELRVCEFCGWVQQKKKKQRAKLRKKKVLKERDPQRDKLF